MTETFQVTGMTCGHCERAVTEAIQAIDAGAQVKIDRASGQVEVQTDSARDAIAKAITEEGYTVQ
jgi:copper chaperone